MRTHKFRKIIHKSWEHLIYVISSACETTLVNILDPTGDYVSLKDI